MKGMTARSHDRGHEIVYKDGKWVFPNEKIRPADFLPCENCGKPPVIMFLAVPIDACIAPIVKALQGGGIDMEWSCCGHGKKPGEIKLTDGRILKIMKA
jgi:hypothetical protein